MCDNCSPEIVRWVMDMCCPPITSDYLTTADAAERMRWNHMKPLFSANVPSTSESDGDKIKLWTLTKPYG